MKILKKVKDLLGYIAQEGGGGVLRSTLAGYVLLASQNPTPL